MLHVQRNINSHFAGRIPVGSVHPVVLTKNKQYHTRQIEGMQQNTLACGLACSEIFSGRNLAKVLRPGFEYERAVLDALERDEEAPPLSIHTSAGVPEAMSTFIAELSHHLPWNIDPGDEDWCVSLQMEGASAVLAAVDLMIQVRHESCPAESPREISKWKIAVGETSYHGPPSTSPGSNTPLCKEKHNQIEYPVPSPHAQSESQEGYLNRFSTWLDENYDNVGCILIEPQWGSTAAAFPWSPDTLRQVVALSHQRGILVVADEIMCGLARHGQGTLFLSEAWNLDVDAVTFGKAVAAGAFPLSGVIMRKGAGILGRNGRSALQSHTYSGGNIRALLTATEVLKEISTCHSRIQEKGLLLSEQMQAFQQQSAGLFRVQGMGLMWGALVNKEHNYIISGGSVKALMDSFKESCKKSKVLPYFVPAGGFMVTPLFDVESAVVTDIGSRLCQALNLTLQWIVDLP